MLVVPPVEMEYSLQQLIDAWLPRDLRMNIRARKLGSLVVEEDQRSSTKFV